MHPLTLDRPKPLLPVGASTLVEHQVAAVAAAGAKRIVLATGYRHEDFADVLSRCRAVGRDLDTVVETTPQGTGGGLREALRALPDADAVLVLNGDLLTGHDLTAQVEGLVAADEGVLASVHVRQVEDPERYGAVLIDPPDRVTAFVEKSPNPPSHTVNAGTYVVRPRLLGLIPPTGVASLERDVFPVLAARGALLAHREEAYFLDVGSPAALIAANRDLVLGRGVGDRAGDARPRDARDALVLPWARVDPSARLIGGSVVHPGASIGPGALLDSALVLPDAAIGDGAELVRCVVGAGARVGPGARLVDSALGSDVVVAAGERAHGLVRPPAG